jgi:hypothetical protein
MTLRERKDIAPVQSEELQLQHGRYHFGDSPLIYAIRLSLVVCSLGLIFRYENDRPVAVTYTQFNIHAMLHYCALAIVSKSSYPGPHHHEHVYPRHYCTQHHNYKFPATQFLAIIFESSSHGLCCLIGLVAGFT